MTAEDRDEVRTIVKEEIQQALESALESRPTKEEMKNALQATRDEIVEAVRDMQTEILRGLERFSRGNFSRFHTIETTQADVNIRLGLLEERVLAVELRVPPQPPQH
jgi:hypothetical protein